MRTGQVMRVAGAVAVTAVIAGCGGDGVTSSAADGRGSGICNLTVEFRDAFYTASGSESAEDVKVGRRLGKATPVPCGGTDGPADGEVTIYSIVGKSPSETVLARPEVGAESVLSLDEGAHK
jgi:hypothetical protein